jgi:hypothetical protein
VECLQNQYATRLEIDDEAQGEFELFKHHPYCLLSMWMLELRWDFLTALILDG